MFIIKLELMSNLNLCISFQSLFVISMKTVKMLENFYYEID